MRWVKPTISQGMKRIKENTHEESLFRCKSMEPKDIPDAHTFSFHYCKYCQTCLHSYINDTMTMTGFHLYPPPHPTLLLPHQSCWSFSEDLDFFCCKRLILLYRSIIHANKYEGKHNLCHSNKKEKEKLAIIF